MTAMSVISINDLGPLPPPDNHVPCIRARMAVVSGDRAPTPFGWWLTEQMAAHHIDTQSDLARLITATDEARTQGIRIPQSTISRWIYEPGRPDPAKVVLLAPVFGVDPGEVLHRAGVGRPTTPDGPNHTDPLLAKIAILIGDNSPVPPGRLDKLRATLELVVEPYEEYLPGIRRVS